MILKHKHKFIFYKQEKYNFSVCLQTQYEDLFFKICLDGCEVTNLEMIKPKGIKTWRETDTFVIRYIFFKENFLKIKLN